MDENIGETIRGTTKQITYVPISKTHNKQKIRKNKKERGENTSRS